MAGLQWEQALLVRLCRVVARCHITDPNNLLPGYRVEVFAVLHRDNVVGEALASGERSVSARNEETEGQRRKPAKKTGALPETGEDSYVANFGKYAVDNRLFPARFDGLLAASFETNINGSGRPVRTCK